MKRSLEGKGCQVRTLKKKSPLSARTNVTAEGSSLDFLLAVEDAGGLDSHWCLFINVDQTHVSVRFETYTQSGEYLYIFLSCLDELRGWRLVRFVDVELCEFFVRAMFGSKLG